jgi:hypothetical protein
MADHGSGDIMKRRDRQKGQALIEWFLLFPLYFSIFMATWVFGQWFLVRQQLIMGCREAALLYSSGRLTAPEVNVIVRQSLAKGRPGLDSRCIVIRLGRASGWQAVFYNLDEVSVTFTGTLLIHRFTKKKPMEETCVIKHAPAYGVSGLVGLQVRPPVPWEQGNRVFAGS